MKFENNWRYKTLENLEKDNWGSIPDNESYLVTTIHKLRKKPLIEYTIEDLRIMIGQNLGLSYLIPIALEELEKDILAEGDFYEGDLLHNVLESDTNYWKKEKGNWDHIINLCESNLSKLLEFDTTESIRNKWIQGIENLKSLN